MADPRMTFVIRVWLLLTRGLPFLFSYIARRTHTRIGAEPTRFPERLGTATAQVEEPVIWFHAASLGEVMQVGPLVRHLSNTERKPILITTTTKAGADWVARALPDILHQYAPIDTPAAVANFLDAHVPAAAIFIEGDLWPRMVLETQKRGCPMMLLNARHSRTRERFSASFTRLLSGFALITARSEEIAESIKALKLPHSRVEVLPDLRIATANLPCPADTLETLKQQIGTRPVWLAASTHPADEDAVLAAHQDVMAAHPDALLILAPRHSHRGEPLVAMAQDQNINFARRSTGDPIKTDTQLYLADTLGELGIFFSLAPLTFLGGSLGDEGGHNPYEPARFGSAIFSGPKVKNFADAYAALTKAGAAETVDSSAALGQRLAGLIGTDEAKAMGKAGQAFMSASENSVSKTIALIKDALTD